MQDYDFDLQSIQAVRDLARKGKIAANQLAHYDEEQIDRILRNMVKAAEEKIINGELDVKSFFDFENGAADYNDYVATVAP